MAGDANLAVAGEGGDRSKLLLSGWDEDEDGTWEPPEIPNPALPSNTKYLVKIAGDEDAGTTVDAKKKAKGKKAKGKKAKAAKTTNPPEIDQNEL